MSLVEVGKGREEGNEGRGGAEGEVDLREEVRALEGRGLQGGWTTRCASEKRESRLVGLFGLVGWDSECGLVSAGVALVEKIRPFVAAASPEKRKSRCHMCFKEAKSVNCLCGGCKWAKYCGAECQRQAWMLYHKYECQAVVKAQGTQLEQLYQSSTMLLIAARVCFIRRAEEDLRDLAASDEQTEKVQYAKKLLKMREEDGCLCKYFDDLERHEKDFSPSRKTEFTMQGFGLSKFVGGCPAVAGKPYASADSHTKTLFAFSVNMFTCPERDQMICSPLLSLFMHSCCPNAIVDVLDDGNTNLLAIGDVAEGQPITFSYCSLRSTYESRQDSSTRGYFFRCKCPRCLSPEAREKDKLFGAYRCEDKSCPGIVQGLSWDSPFMGGMNKEEQQPAPSSVNTYPCSVCGKPNLKAPRCKPEAISLWSDVISSAGTNKNLAAMRKLHAHLTKYLHPRNVVLGQIRENMAIPLLAAGAFEEATEVVVEIEKDLKYAESCVTFIEGPPYKDLANFCLNIVPAPCKQACRIKAREIGIWAAKMACDRFALTLGRQNQDFSQSSSMLITMSGMRP